MAREFFTVLRSISPPALMTLLRPIGVDLQPLSAN